MKFKKKIKKIELLPFANLDIESLISQKLFKLAQFIEDNR